MTVSGWASCLTTLFLLVRDERGLETTILIRSTIMDTALVLNTHMSQHAHSRPRIKREEKPSLAYKTQPQWFSSDSDKPIDDVRRVAVCPRRR